MLGSVVVAAAPAFPSVKLNLPDLPLVRPGRRPPVHVHLPVALPLYPTTVVLGHHIPVMPGPVVVAATPAFPSVKRLPPDLPFVRPV